MRFLAMFGLALKSEMDAAAEVERKIVAGRDLIILERDEEIVKLQARLKALDVPAEEVPFCVNCHKGIKRGMPFHILTIRHGDCRFVGEPKDSPALANTAVFEPMDDVEYESEVL